jgi:hypothetical protein
VSDVLLWEKRGQIAEGAEREKAMKRHTCRIGLMLMTLVGLGVACQGIARAQQLPKDALAFKAEVSGSFTGLPPVPTEPPVIAWWMSLKGRSDLMGGEITFVDTHYWQMGIDGTPATATSLGGVFTSASGDALFVVWDAVPRPDGVVGGYGRFVVRGGRGRFAGASGSGTMLSVLKGPTEVTQIYEGSLVLPKR